MKSIEVTSKLAGLPIPLFIPLPGVPIKPASFAARRICGGIKLRKRSLTTDHLLLSWLYLERQTWLAAEVGEVLPFGTARRGALQHKTPRCLTCLQKYGSRLRWIWLFNRWGWKDVTLTILINISEIPNPSKRLLSEARSKEKVLGLHSRQLPGPGNNRWLP